MSDDIKKHFIHGKHIALSNNYFETYNPANNKPICKISLGGKDDVNKAIQSAKEGFIIWSKMSATERGRILNKAANLLRERNDELAKLEVLDTGKPFQEASTVDIQSGADCLEFFAGVAPTISGRHVQLKSGFGYTRREPLGICVGIGAWNYPLQIACWKSAPALACGNVMIFKPSELSPITAIKLAEIYSEAGLPDGVFNVVQGDATTGRLLTTNTEVHKISLTGEVGTGQAVITDAAPSFKHITMELGGKSPLIIFEDADLDNAVSAAMLANFYTQGEICSNGTRVYVHEKVKSEFQKRLIKKTKKIVVGDPQDPTTQMGALISNEHLTNVLMHIDIAVDEGATVSYGGKKIINDTLSQGNFMEPTILTDCHDKMRIVQDEIFGPVMSILSFSDEADVIKRANNSRYGLAAGVFTQNIARAHRVIAQLQAGTCWINNYNITPIELPFGGYKNSGIGRENGLEVINHYTQVKSVYVELGDVDSPY